MELELPVFDELLRPDAKPVIAVTRMRLRSWLLLPAAILRFRRLYDHARRHPSFVRGTVALAGPSLILNISVWDSRAQMLLWSGCDDHVAAVRWAYRHASEVWSSYWELDRLSHSANCWDGRTELAGLQRGARRANGGA